MLIPLRTIHDKYGLKVNGVLHIGAHYGEELSYYDILSYRPVWWIEAEVASFKVLKEHVKSYNDQHCINACVADEVKPVTFHTANNGQSSSILELGTHAQEHPDVVYTGSDTMIATTVDILADKKAIGQANFMNLDIQGAELMALKGAVNYLKNVDYIYSEVNEKELYKGCVQLPELDEWLKEQGFELVELSWTQHGWGDGFWVRNDG